MIPNVIHFIYGLKEDFGGKPFSLVHYLAIRSASEVNQPEAIYFYCKYEPSGYWWNKVLPYIKVKKVNPPKYVYWHRLRHFAHMADVMRLKILHQQGGIYLDLDTISVRPLTDLLKHDFIIGLQSGTTIGLCNAVMMAKPKSKFVKFWLREYIGFRSKGFGHYWDEHSVRVPMKLAEKHPTLLYIANDRAFHYPTWEHPENTKKLFEECHNFKEAYVHHLWESTTWDDYLSKLTVEEVLKKDTSYNKIARQYLSQSDLL
jgi:hypothetical protein